MNDDVINGIMTAIDSKGGIDLFDYRVLFGKTARSDWFFSIIKELERQKVVEKTRTLSDGKKLDFFRWVKTAQWNWPQNSKKKEKNVCYLTAKVYHPQSYNGLFVETLSLPVTIGQRATIKITNGDGREFTETKVSRGFASTIQEWKTKFPNDIIAQVSFGTAPTSYVVSREELAKRLGAIKVEVVSEGHTPPKIVEIRVITTKKQEQEVKEKFQRLLETHNIPATLEYCGLECHKY